MVEMQEKTMTANASRPEQKQNRVAVIGAGMAGVSAALTLSSGGVDVELFDRGRYAGGRLGSFAEPGASQGIEKGPLSFQASHPEFAQQCEQWAQSGLLRRDSRLAKFEFTSTSRDFIKTLVQKEKWRGSLEVSEVVCEPTGVRFCASSTNPAHVHQSAQNFDGYSALLLALPPLQARRLLKSSPCLELPNSFKKR